MLLAKIAAFTISAIACISMVITHIDKWARLLQQYYVRASENSFSGSESWREPWIRTLFKCLVIFFGLMAVIGLYVAFFTSQG